MEAKAAFSDANAVFVSGVGLFSQDERVLLHLRDASPTVHEGGKWALIGGHIEPGEGPEEALRREVKEELGLELEAFRLLIRIPSGSTTYFLHYGVLPGSTEDIELTEGQEVRLFTTEEALGLDSLTDVARLFIETFEQVNTIRQGRGYPSVLRMAE